MVRNCAHRLRVAYALPRPVDLADLDDLHAGEVEIQRFSTFVEGAADHFRFRIGDLTLASGTLAGTTLVVTYGKLGADAPPQDRVGVERVLIEVYGPIAA